MEIAAGLSIIAVAVVLFDQLARRIGMSAPLLLLLVGIAASFVPGMPSVHLEADIVLLGLLPPLLYATAMRTSAIDFRANLRPIAYLSVLLVIVTAAIAGLVAWLILPIPYAAAFALGAVVAPPDAVAATAVARKVGLPRRLVSILEGESLVNDASAITCLRAAIAAMAGTATAWSVEGQFLLALFGGVAIGLLVAVIAIWIRRRVHDPVADTAVSFILPWAAYLPAEEAHSSGVIAVVTAGLILGHKSAVVQTAQSRVSERTNWTTVQFLLENAVFLLIGLQARWILDDVLDSGMDGWTVVAVCAAVLATVIVVRLVWVVAGGRLLMRRGPDDVRTPRPPLAWTLVVGWAGMRGVVTMAAAFLLPESTPQRNVLIFVALVVTMGTLLLQGTTLPILVRRLGIKGPDPRSDALATATVLENAGTEALAALDKLPDIHPDTRVALERRIRQHSNQLWERLGRSDGDENPSDEYSRLRLHTLDIERSTVLRMRGEGRVDQEVLGIVLASLDVEESMLTAVVKRIDLLEDDMTPIPITPADCTHLREAPTDTRPTSRVCQDCVREGTKTVHLRMCTKCGNVGCCDSSEAAHATRHYETTGHPVMRSFEPGEDWRWCFPDQQVG